MDSDSATSDDLTDVLAICASENLTHLGLVQSHGCLVAIDDKGLIAFAGGNADFFLGTGPDKLVGTEASRVSFPDGLSLANWVERLAPADSGLVHAECKNVDDGVVGDVYGHRMDGLTIVEIAIPTEAVPAENSDSASDIEAIKACTDIFSAAAVIVDGIRNITGYDRVMVYRFLPDNSGDIIAENRQADLTPFIGLRYPASDIPENARRLYLKSPIRIVANARSTPTPLEALTPSASCDLSNSVLRAVSSFHIEYLRNMGVTATLVTSVVVDGKLWGLIACHHGSAFVPSADMRQKCLELTREFSDQIRNINIEKEKDTKERTYYITKKLLEDTKTSESLWYALLFGRNRLTLSWEIHGCALRINDTLYTVGYCPPHDKIFALEEHATSLCRKQSATTACPLWTSTEIKPLVGDFPGPTAGAAYVRVSEEPDVGIFLFRNELKREVYWGGNPEKAIEIDHGKKRVSPRQSFERWVTEVGEMSADWEGLETEGLRHLALALRQLRDDEFRDLVYGSATSPRRFSDILFNQEVNEVKAIVDDFIPEGIAAVAFVKSPSVEYLRGFANATFCDFLGLRRAEVTEDNIGNLLGLAGLDTSLMNLEGTAEKTIELTSPKLGQRTVRASRVDLISRHSHNGGVDGVSVLYLHDDTERKRIIEALDVSRRQRHATSMFKAEILGSLSHELRTPLNAIIGYMEAMSMGLVKDEKQTKQYSENVLEAGRQMLSLVEGLLDVAKIEHGILQIDESWFDIREQLEIAARITAIQAQSHAQVLESQITTGKAQLLGDETAFQQIVLNLLNNAVKFSPPGGRILLRAELSSMNTLIIRVEDAGPGIRPEQRAGIFEPFSQIEGVEVRTRPGAGIGLSIVKSYVELHGGSVSVDDSELGGAAFTVKIPNWRIRIPRDQS